MLFILCFYVIIGAAVLTIFTHELIVMSKKALIVEYFLCESKGTLPDSNVSRCVHLEESVQKLFNPISSAAAIMIFIGFVPSVNLVYVFKFNEFKSKLKMCFQKNPRRMADRQSQFATYHPDHDSECKSTTLNHGLLT